MRRFVLALLACLLAGQAFAGATLPPNPRQRLSATLSYTVAHSTGNDANSCLSFATACKTIQGAVNLAYSKLDTAGNTVNILLSVPQGPYTETTTINGPMVGGGTLVITTITGGPALVTTTSANAFTVNGGASVQFKNLQISTITSGAGIIANNGSTVTIGSGMVFGNVVAAMLDSRSYSNIVLSSGYTISGNATSAIHADGMGSLLLDNQVITCTGSPAFSAYFVGVGTGYVEAIGTTFSGCGTVTGLRFLVNNNGALRTDNGSLTFFPGDTQGYTVKGGAFDSLITSIRTIASGSSDTTASDGIGGMRDATILWKSASGAPKSQVLVPCTGTGPFQQVTIKDSQGDANTQPITITASATTFDGAANRVINTAFGAVTLQCNQVSDYNVISSK